MDKAAPGNNKTDNRAMDQDLINRIVEAALLAANQPLTLTQLHALFPEEQPAPNGSVEQALETLRAGCTDRGVELVELASGFRFQVKADVHAWVARLWTDRKTRYTRATLETLALIAYRQPITRGEIEQVRGVAVSSNIIQSLEEREWIRVVGHRDVPGKPALYGTTKAFLDYFGLKRLDELPPLSELKDIGELEPELQFDNVLDGPAPAEAEPIDAGGIASGDHGESAEGGSAEAGDASGDEAEASDAAFDPAAPEPDEPADMDDPENADEQEQEPPDAAPGECAADENEIEEDAGWDSNDPDTFSDAVETTTVPMTDDDAEELA